MRLLHVQLQPARVTDLDAEAAVARLQKIAAAVVSRGEDDGPYINVDFLPTDVRALWPAVRAEIQASRELAACVIACCEGERGWDDYLLLHHYNPAELLDEMD